MRGNSAPGRRRPAGRDNAPDLDALLHPAQAFAHPLDVVNDPDLTLSEKRAILASWVSDACAVDSDPALRRPPGAKLVHVDDLTEALRALDRQAGRYKPRPHYRRVLEERILRARGRKPRGKDDRGQPAA
jgi:hypothetical protein